MAMSNGTSQTGRGFARKEPTIRPLKLSLNEHELFADWIKANAEKNNLDPAMLAYPATTVLVADGGESQYQRKDP
jgi:hypothetical protein